MVKDIHHIDYFLNKDVLTIYANYGFAALKFWDEVIATAFYNSVWKVCLETESNLKYLKKHQIIRGYNGIVTGYFKADLLADCDKVNNTKKMVIISPHHTVMGWKKLNISNFLRFSELFIRLPKMYPQINFVFRPHPLLFPNLKEYNVWSDEQIKDYKIRLLSSSNMLYDQSGDYSSLFVNSDAIIHDCGSFIGEYLFVEKPCCYMMKSLEDTMDGLVPLGKECMDCYYHAFTEDDIINFIEDVVVKGRDPLKESRRSFAENTLYTNYPNSSKRFLDYLKKTIRGN